MHNPWIGVLLYISCVVYVSCQICPDTESDALLKIREEILQGWSSFNFSSWNTDSDCCQWKGVVCNTSTGSVMQLGCDLGNGTLSPSVCSLTNLEQLFLTGSHSEGMRLNIPSCIWYMTQLRILDVSSPGLQFEDPQFTNTHKVFGPMLTTLGLSDCNLTGMLPAWMGNLSQLQELTLSFNNITGLPESLGNVSQLRYLDLSSNRITGLPQFIGNLSQLSSLSVSHNFISSFPQSLGKLSNLVYFEADDNLISDVSYLGNLTQLSTLLLRENEITHLSQSITSLSTLSSLELDYNHLSDVHPSFVNMSGLSQLSLTYNKLTDIELPHFSVLRILFLTDNLIENFESFLGASSLISIDLSYNRLTRFDLSSSSLSFSFPIISNIELQWNYLRSVSLGNISSLVSISLENNLLQSIPLESLLKQTALSTLSIDSNPLQGPIPPEMSSLSNLYFLTFSRAQLTGPVPTSFTNLTSLMYLSLAENNLTGPIPNMRLNFTISPYTLINLTFNFSHNSFSGGIPEIACSTEVCGPGVTDSCVYSRTLDLSHNQLTGDVSTVASRCPTQSNMGNTLLLSDNNLDGFIPESFIWGAQPSINSSRFFILDLSHNRLKGSVDSRLLTSPSRQDEGCIMDPSSAAYLDLSNNELTGSVPEILTNCSNIGRLKLGNNFLQGEIPESLGRAGQSLLTLSLRDNDLHGPIPSSLGNCSSLQVLDLSGNRLTGPLPLDLLPLNATLRVLSVARNNLSGLFPSWITSFHSVQVLDLSHNNFYGMIPEGVDFSQLTAFVDGEVQNVLPDTLFSESISFGAKGGTFDLVYVLAITTYFGIAHNHFYGPVPRQLGLLRGLVYLDLAGNAFNGSIPDSFGELQNLDSLDLSDNDLSGRIPITFLQLTRISYCNISFNKLYGPIPGGQMSTLDISNYIQNAGLCALPLPSCSPPASSPISPVLGIPPQVSDMHVRSAFEDWISIPAAQLGFLLGFIGITFSFLLTERLRFASILFAFQPRNSEPVYIYNKPYGVYLPPE